MTTDMSKENLCFASKSASVNGLNIFALILDTCVSVVSSVSVQI